MNPALNNSIFGDLIYDNKSTYTFNEVEFESGRLSVVSHLTSNTHSSVGIDNLASRLGLGISTALRTSEANTQIGVRQSNFYLGGRCLISCHDRLHYKRFHDWFYSDTTYVRQKFQSLHGDSCVQFFSMKYHFTRAYPMAGDIGENVGNTLLSFTQQLGVPDELVTDNNQKIS